MFGIESPKKPEAKGKGRDIKMEKLNDYFAKVSIK